MPRIGAHSISNRNEFDHVNNRVKALMLFGSAFMVMSFAANFGLIISRLPIFTNEKQLPINICFPFDWRRNEIVFWMTYTFVSFEMLLGVVCIFLNIIVWYLMMSSAIKYQTLGSDFKRLGCDDSDGRRNVLEELIKLTKRHRDLKEYFCN